MNPDTAEGWKEIAAAMGVHKNTAQTYAKRDVDPLPVRVNHRGPWAYMSALRDWVHRQDMAWTVAQRLRPQTDKNRIGSPP